MKTPKPTITPDQAAKMINEMFRLLGAANVQFAAVVTVPDVDASGEVTDSSHSLGAMCGRNSQMKGHFSQTLVDLAKGENAEFFRPSLVMATIGLANKSNVISLDEEKQARSGSFH